MALKRLYTKFQGFFYDTEGAKYTVNIATEEYVSTVQDIKLGATPFVVDCDADENYFKPVRTRTAKLTVIDEDGTLYDQIMPKDNFSTSVSLSRNGFPISFWYVSCESYEKPLVSRPSEVTFNLNGILAMTEFIKADPIYSNTTALYGLLRSIGKGFNTGVSGYRRFWFPKTFSYENLIDYSWFFESRKYKELEGDRIEIIGKSILSIIEAFCKFYGLVAIENYAGDIVFVSDLYSYDYQDYLLKYSSLPEISIQADKLTQKQIQWSDLVWMGTDHTINTIRPAKSVSVVSKIDEYNNKMSLPSFASKEYHIGNIDSRDFEYNCYSLMSDMEKIGGTLIMGKPRAFVVNLKKELSSANSYYVSEYTITYNGEAEGAYDTNASILYLGPWGYPLSKNWDKIASNSFKLNADELTNAQVWCGAFMARSEIYTGQEKGAYNLTDVLFVSGLCYNKIHDITPVLPEQFSNMKAATLRSDKYVKIYNGYVNIKAAAKIIDYYGNFLDSYNIAMNFQLKIGNRYYNGSEWTEDESFFSISFANGKISGNKTPFMQTTEEDGFFIEIPAGQYQEGIVELSVSPAFWKVGSTDNGSLPMCAMFSELSVNFTYKKSDLAFGDKENVFLSILDDGAKDEIEVENDIASDCYNKAAENIIKKQYSLDNAQTDDKNNIRPELLLLSRMKEYYSKKRSILSLEVAYGELTYRDLYSVILQDGKTYFPFGYSIDYKANKVNLKLFEQPDYPDDIIP